ncbi:cytochrome P450 [Streptomyces qinzhouensis]|uniref:cytochrome P450 n=1 Tax=Streptomyces qinzhouensis TaxID=2599401 RepID=UPI001FECCE4E|nr:cytochrome P450 [Streptomyces qinzhouensis]
MPPTTTGRPVPGALPLFGHTLRLARNPTAFLASLPDHGDLVELRLGPVRAYVVCDPGLAHRALSDVRTFDKGGPFYDAARQETGNGIITCRNAEHPEHRELVWPAFHRSRMPAYATVMAQQISTAGDSWHHGQVIDLIPQTGAMAAAVTAKVMFAHQSDDMITDVTRCFDTLLSGLFRRMILPAPLLHRLPTPGNRRHERARHRLHRIIDDLIDAHPGTDQGDLLSTLLDARTDYGRALTLDQLRDQVFNVFIAGTDTTASTLAWALHLVTTHPQVQQQLQTEADAVLSGRPARYDDIPQLPVTGRILTETLRLYPSAWLLTRTATRDTDLAGHHLPAGSTLILSPYVIHHRADLYPEPERFDPDRWLTPARQRTARGEYIPFGVGPRQCIGRLFGTTAATLALATIAARWHLQPATTTPVRPLPRATMSARTMPVRLQRRTTPHDPSHPS